MVFYVELKNTGFNDELSDHFSSFALSSQER